MHGKFPAIQQNQRNSILFHETIPLMFQVDVSKISMGMAGPKNVVPSESG
jgi:hypothetical protein